MKRNTVRISVLLLPLLAVGLLASELGRAGDLLFIGGTAAEVEAPVDGATIEEWGLDGSDVVSAKVSFGSDLDDGSRVCVQAADNAGPVANGCDFLDAPWGVDDDPVQVDFGAGTSDNFGSGPGATTIPASALTRVDVTVLGPINTDIQGDAAIEVMDVRWVLQGSDTSQVAQVNVVFAPYGKNVNTCGKDGVCDFDMLFALQDSDGLTLAKVKKEDVELDPDGTTMEEWDLTVPPSIPGESVSAEAITRFVIGVEPGDPWDVLDASVPDKVGQGAGMTTDGTSLFLLRGGNGAQLYRFDPGNGWTELEPAPKAPKQGGALVYAEDGSGKGHLYAFRGGSKTDFWRYDIGADAWSAGRNDPADLPKGNGVKWGGSLAWDSGNFIYAFQGGDTPNFWRYSISGNSWKQMDSTPDVVKEGGALVYVDGLIYGMQGGTDNGFWKFDPLADVGYGEWFPEQAANIDITIGRGGALATNGDNLIYALRGDDTREIWRYQISAKEWVIGPDIPLPMREGGTLAFLGGDVYATQGRQQSEFLRISPLPPF